MTDDRLNFVTSMLIGVLRVARDPALVVDPDAIEEAQATSGVFAITVPVMAEGHTRYRVHVEAIVPDVNDDLLPHRTEGGRSAR